LDAVCRKAMALEPADRYPSARALAEDLDRWLAGEPVAAWPEPWSVRAQRWVGRHRTLVTTTGVALAVAVVLLSAATFALTRAYQETDSQRILKENALERVQQALGDVTRESGLKELALGDARAAAAREADEKKKAQTNEEEALRQKGIAQDRETLARHT